MKNIGTIEMKRVDAIACIP